MSITIVIPGESLPSWNVVMRMHKHAQHTVHTLWMLLAANALGHEVTPFAGPVNICVTSYQKRLMIDPDNLYAKGVIDGIKKQLFGDDSPRWVDGVTLRSRKDKKRPRVEILITEIG